MLSTKKIKYVLFISCALLVLGAPLLTTLAQTEQEFLDDNGTTLEPQLYVHHVEVDEIPSGAKQITGTFSLFNVGLQTAGDISHQASLVTLQEINGRLYPVEMLVSGKQSERYASPNGEQKKNFSVPIPTSLPAGAKFGVYVEIFTEDEPGTYEYAPVEFPANQTAQQLVFVDAVGMLRIGKEQFYLLEGPTVLNGEQVSMYVNVASTSAYTTIKPQMDIYAGPMITETPLRTMTLSPLVLSNEKTVEAVYPLPVDLGPGVYTVRLRYLNEAGLVVSSLLEARYILDGLKSNIHSVTYNDLNQNNIDSFDVSVQYAEKPISARIAANGEFLDDRAEAVFVREGEDAPKGEVFASANGLTIKVTLTDEETGKQIAEQVSDVAATKPTVFSFNPIYGSTKVAVSVELFEDAVSIDTHTANIEVQPRESWLYDNRMMVGLVAFIVPLILLAGLWMLRRKFARTVTVPTSNKQ